MRPCHSWTQRDTAGPAASTQTRLDVLDLRKCRLESLAHGSRPPWDRSRAAAYYTPLTGQDLAHHWPTATGNGLSNRSRTRCRPGLREHRHRGLTWGFGWQVLGSNQRRLSRRFYSEPIPTHQNSH
jgi:hypothetical protein